MSNPYETTRGKRALARVTLECRTKAHRETLMNRALLLSELERSIGSFSLCADDDGSYQVVDGKGWIRGEGTLDATLITATLGTEAKARP